MKSLLCALLAVFSCSATLAAPPSSNAADQTEAVSGSNAFAVDLYAQLALAARQSVLFAGEHLHRICHGIRRRARPTRLPRWQHVFHFTLPPDKLHPAMGALLNQMNAVHKGYELRVADALWAQQDANFLPEYLKLVQSDYGAGFRRVDFKSSPDAVRGAINAWVEKQTNDKIKDLLGPGVLNATTRLVLTNAIYFKGDWQDPFEEDTTQKEEFHVSPSQCDHGAADAPHRRLQLLRRRHISGARAALRRQRDVDGGSAAEARPMACPRSKNHSHQAAAGDWLGKLEPADKVILTFPRFTMTQQFELSSALSTMGMAQAFTNSADFSGMTGKPDFTISAAIHKAYIDVNEKGTEAAAATAIVMRATAMRASFPEPPPIVFRADHPFLFLIRDTKTGAILFLGRVTDPTK